MELVPTKKRLGRLYEAKQEGDDITVHIKVTTTSRQNFPELKPGFKELVVNRKRNNCN